MTNTPIDPQQPKKALAILDDQITAGLHEHRRPTSGLALSSLSAGMEVGFSVFLMAILYSLFHESLSNSALHVLLAIAYPIGFVFVVIGRSELFTEHTTTAVLPVFSGQASLTSLGRVWATVYTGNLLGGYLFTLIILTITPAMGIMTDEAFYHLAHNMVKYDWNIIFGSGILAGWLMGLLTWLVTSCQETISRIFMVILITTVIGLGGLHHSIVGSIEVFIGLVTRPEITLADYLTFQLWTTLGNTVGGAVFVGLMKYSHTKKSDHENNTQSIKRRAMDNIARKGKF